MSKKFLTLISVMLIAVFVLAACAPAATPTATVEPTAAPVEPTAAPVEPTAAPTEAAPAATLRVWADDTRAPVLQDLAEGPGEVRHLGKGPGPADVQPADQLSGPIGRLSQEAHEGLEFGRQELLEVHLPAMEAIREAADQFLRAAGHQKRSIPAICQLPSI